MGLFVSHLALMLFILQLPSSKGAGYFLIEVKRIPSSAMLVFLNNIIVFLSKKCFDAYVVIYLFSLG